MILGLRTAIYPTADLARGKAWYSQLLGKEPYFDQPFYVGFNVGGFELGLVPDQPPAAADDGPISFWGVADIHAARQRLIDFGAVPVTEITDVGDGIKVTTVRDPFRNLVGLIENPHFKSVG